MTDPTPDDLKAAEESEGAGFEFRADRAAFLRGMLAERAKGKKRAKPKAEPPGWAAFWSAYPRKVAKPDALRAFIRLAPADLILTAMLAALDRQKASDDWTKSGGQFIPYPATYLNQRRWEDDPGQPGRSNRIGLAEGQRVSDDDSAPWVEGADPAGGPG